MPHFHGDHGQIVALERNRCGICGAMSLLGRVMPYREPAK
jgi:hypothetical protein